MADLDRWNESCNTLDGPLDKICFVNKKMCKFISNCYKTLEISKNAFDYDLHEL